MKKSTMYHTLAVVAMISASIAAFATNSLAQSIGGAILIILGFSAGTFACLSGFYQSREERVE